MKDYDNKEIMITMITKKLFRRERKMRCNNKIMQYKCAFILHDFFNNIFLWKCVYYSMGI